MSFSDRYEQTLSQLQLCCEQAGRDVSEVCVVAVSKTVGIKEVSEAVAANVHDFGENRPDVMIPKALEFPCETWHFIGNIQSRRIPEIVKHSALIHSVYQERHIAKIDVAAQALGKVQDILLEVNISGESSKSGLEPQAVLEVLKRCGEYEHIRVRGLMTMAPQGDMNAARSCFEELARLQEDLRLSINDLQALHFDELSMGMSEDWPIAVAAGATIVRIGRALFDETYEDMPS